jgi:hypothetical protein
VLAIDRGLRPKRTRLFEQLGRGRRFGLTGRRDETLMVARKVHSKETRRISIDAIRSDVSFGTLCGLAREECRPV